MLIHSQSSTFTLIICDLVYYSKKFGESFCSFEHIAGGATRGDIAGDISDCTIDAVYASKCGILPVVSTAKVAGFGCYRLKFCKR